MSTWVSVHVILLGLRHESSKCVCGHEMIKATQGEQLTMALHQKVSSISHGDSRFHSNGDLPPPEEHHATPMLFRHPMVLT